MHVLLTGDAVGGVWHYVVDLATGLRARGVTVTIAILGPAPSPVQLKSLGDLPLITMGLPLDWTADSAADVADAAAALARLATSIGADLVHLHSPSLGAAGDYLMPVVAVCHSCVATWWDACGSGPLPEALAWRRDLAAKGARRVDVLLAPTAAFAAETMRVYALPAAPVVIHNGRRARPAATSDQAGPRVFTAGRLWDRAKGMDMLDRVAALMSVGIDAAGSAVAPDGEPVSLPNLNLLGHLDEDSVAHRLASQPVFVSLARYEPFGLAVLEAAQAGCALVLADIPSFRELWDGAALFVDPADAFTVSQVIETLLHHPEGQQRFGAQAQARAAQYSLDAMTDRVLDVFRNLLMSAEPRPRFAALSGAA